MASSAPRLGSVLEVEKAALANKTFLHQLLLPSLGGRLTSSADRLESVGREGRSSLGWFETLLFIALILCTALRFVALGSQSLWADELFSVFWAKGGAAYVLSHAASETNPPLYYLLLNFWMRLFGDSEFAVRLLSACASTVNLSILFLLGRALFGRLAGLTAALLFALSPWHLYFAQEARSFALFNLAFTIQLWSILVVTVRLRRGHAVGSVLASVAAAAFLLSAAACAYLHYVFFPLLGTIGICTALVWWRYFSFSPAYFACFATLGGGGVLLSLPSLALAVWQRHSPSVAWMSFPSATKFLGLLTGAPAWTAAPDWVMGGVILLSGGSAVIWASLLAYGGWTHRKDAAFVWVYLLPVVGFSVLAILSVAQPFLFARTVIWLSIPVYLGLGGGVAAFNTHRERTIAAALVILASAAFTGGYFAFPSKEPWRALVSHYAETMRKGGRLVLGTNTPAIAFVYYGANRVVPQLRRWPDSTTSADRLDERVTGIKLMNDAELQAAIQHGDRIFFLSRECAAPAGIPRADIDLIFHCDGSALGGWELIGAFLRHSGVNPL